MVSCSQREVGDAVAEAWADAPPGMDPLVRMLLAADRYAAAGLRAECLRRLAARFDRLGAAAEDVGRGLAVAREGPAPLPVHERSVFDAFLAVVAPSVRPHAQGTYTPCLHFCTFRLVLA